MLPGEKSGWLIYRTCFKLFRRKHSNNGCVALCLNEEKKSADRGGSRSVRGGLSVRGKGLTAWKGRGLAEGDFDAVNDVDGGGESSEGGFVRRGDYLHAGEVVNAILSVLVSYDAADGACLDDVMELESGRCIGGVAEVEVAFGEGDYVVTFCGVLLPEGLNHLVEAFAPLCVGELDGFTAIDGEGGVA